MLDNLTLDGYNEYKSTIGGRHQEMEWLFDRSSQDNNVAYAVVMDDGRLHRFSYHVCFGRLCDLASSVSGTPHAILIQINTNFLNILDVPDERTNAYFKWLYTQSPFSDCFLNTWEQALTDGVVAITTDVQSGLLAAACSAVRLPWESWYREYNLPSIVTLWYEVVSRHPDIDPTIAFAFCNSMSSEDNNTFTIRGNTAGHQFLTTDCFEAVNAFVNRDPDPTPIYRSYKEYDGITDIWNKGAYDGRDLESWMKERMIGDKKQVNIFMADHHSIYYTLEQAVAGIVKCVHDYQEGRDS